MDRWSVVSTESKFHNIAKGVASPFEFWTCLRKPGSTVQKAGLATGESRENLVSGQEGRWAGQ